jgi:hypothetical protein
MQGPAKRRKTTNTQALAQNSIVETAEGNVNSYHPPLNDNEAALPEMTM